MGTNITFKSVADLRNELKSEDTSSLLKKFKTYILGRDDKSQEPLSTLKLIKAYVEKYNTEHGDQKNMVRIWINLIHFNWICIQVLVVDELSIPCYDMEKGMDGETEATLAWLADNTAMTLASVSSSSVLDRNSREVIVMIIVQCH